jgi:hypothetical protein
VVTVKSSADQDRQDLREESGNSLLTNLAFPEASQAEN